MQVDRARVHGCGRLAGLGTPDHPAGVGLDDGDLASGRTPNVHPIVWINVRRREVFPRSTPQQALADQVAGHRFDVPRQHLGILQGHFGGRAEQLRSHHVGVGRVDHHPLDRFPEQCLGMVHQIGVERIVTGDQHHQRALAATARSAGLLPERGNGSGETSQQHGVEPGDVDAEFQRVRGGQPAQFAVGQRILQRAAVLGEVTGAVGGHRGT